MRKRIIAMLCVCLCILGLTACGTDPKAMDYNGKSYDELETTSLEIWEELRTMDMAEIETIVAQVDAMSDAEQVAFMEANKGADMQITLFRGWLAVSKEVGNYVEVDRFEVERSGKSLITELILEFEERPVVFQVVYKNRDMSIETTTIDLVYSTSEKMEKALLNTVMGMGTVFVMLIVICLIISCFSFIPKLEARFKGKKQIDDVKEEKKVKATPAPVPAVEVELTDDYELVAVIAAAIAASTGQSTSDFVVRSIKRR